MALLQRHAWWGPPPMISGPILAVLAAAILLVSAPRFVRADQ
jgi:hypothetical protein